MAPSGQKSQSTLYRLGQLRSQRVCVSIYIIYMLTSYVAHKRKKKIWSIKNLYELLKITVFM